MKIIILTMSAVILLGCVALDIGGIYNVSRVCMDFKPRAKLRIRTTVGMPTAEALFALRR